MKCQQCDKQAVFHITELESGDVRELHLCEDHARAYLNQAEGGGGSDEPAESGGALTGPLTVGQTADELAVLNREFADLVVQGSIEEAPPHAAELRDEDNLHLPRIRFVFGKHAFGDLRLLINRLNSFHPL